MLCAPLWVDDQALGTLSLYAPEAGAFSEHDQRIAGTFATLAALALAEARRTEHLTVAIAHRDLIGQAKGIIMERFDVDAVRAFQLLTS
jgi:GAF domain-containing protein